jgi:hypothetical protein
VKFYKFLHWLFSGLFCDHKGWAHIFVRNIHGDEINMVGGYRSVWRCDHCNAEFLESYLGPENK